MFVGQHPLQPPSVQQHAAQLAAGLSGPRMLGLIGQEFRQRFLGQLQGLIALGLGQARRRIDAGDSQFVVDRLREGLRRAGIGSGVLEEIDRLVVMALRAQSVEGLFLLVRPQGVGRKHAEQKYGQQGERMAFARVETIHDSIILRGAAVGWDKIA